MLQTHGTSASVAGLACVAHLWRGVLQHTIHPCADGQHALNFLGPVSRGVERHWKEHRSSKVNKMKKIEADVAAVLNISRRLSVPLGRGRVSPVLRQTAAF